MAAYAWAGLEPGACAVEIVAACGVVQVVGVFGHAAAVIYEGFLVVAVREISSDLSQ